MLTLGSSMDDIIPVISIVGGLLVALSFIVGQVIRSMSKHRCQEQSRREIAAYVSEGSMSADEGARLLDAGFGPQRRSKR